VRFQLSLLYEQPDEQTTAVIDAPADLIPGTYEGWLKTWECALDLAA
jgi:protein-histidine N-methyltransferase